MTAWGAGGTPGRAPLCGPAEAAASPLTRPAAPFSPVLAAESVSQVRPCAPEPASTACVRKLGLCLPAPAPPRPPQPVPVPTQAILCRYNEDSQKHAALSLSKEHNPTQYEERMRIQKAGGNVR